MVIALASLWSDLTCARTAGSLVCWPARPRLPFLLIGKPGGADPGQGHHHGGGDIQLLGDRIGADPSVDEEKRRAVELGQLLQRSAIVIGLGLTVGDGG